MIIAGFGFRAYATLDSLQDALFQAAAGRKIGALSTAADKAQSMVFQDLAETLALPIIPIGANALRAIQTPTQSATSTAERGTGSVAEAAALVGAGQDAKLLQTRVISQDRLATCALAQAPDKEPT
ncbi:MAG: cobalamin biosynthesis protein [Pseudomonadota bacterium]